MALIKKGLLTLYKKGSFNSLKLKGWQNILYFESSEMSRACDIGDFISVAGILKSSSHKIIARVVAIVGDMVYVRCDSNGITPSLGNLCAGKLSVEEPYGDIITMDIQ